MFVTKYLLLLTSILKSALTNMKRSDEIAAKKAKLAELKRQREERQRRQSTQLPSRTAEEPPSVCYLLLFAIPRGR